MASFVVQRGAVLGARCRGLLAARTLATTARAQRIDQVTVVGTGLMGSGIVQVAAATNHKVVMVDTSDELLAKATERIHKSLTRVAKRLEKDDEAMQRKYIDTTMANITATTDLATAAKSDLVVEAIPEKIEWKHDLFSKLDALSPPETIFASNTSSLKIGEIAKVTDRKDRFGGLHFFNPVPVMKLVEVIRTDDTSEATFAKLREFGEAVGKHVVDCKDTPGFIVNRLLVPYLLEAARLVERGEASIEDVDAAMRLGAGHPMGPFQLLDYVGLDTTSFISQGWARDYPDVELFKPVPLIEKQVAEGKLGLKSPKGGFYQPQK